MDTAAYKRGIEKTFSPIGCKNGTRLSFWAVLRSKFKDGSFACQALGSARTRPFPPRLSPSPKSTATIKSGRQKILKKKKIKKAIQFKIRLEYIRTHNAEPSLSPSPRKTFLFVQEREETIVSTMGSSGSLLHCCCWGNRYPSQRCQTTLFNSPAIQVMV